MPALPGKGDLCAIVAMSLVRGIAPHPGDSRILFHLDFDVVREPEDVEAAGRLLR
jgi:hypothetical protein